MLKLKLKSDFSDWYDHAFDLEGLEFKRMMTDGPSRPEMFKLFSKLKIKTPLYGTYNQIKDSLSKESYVVIHYDEKAHCGEGKCKKQIKDLSPFDKNFFLVEYINTEYSNYKSSSSRILCIGDRSFKYIYKNYDDWRSNYGASVISEFKEIKTPSWRSYIDKPLFAIDFVIGLAIDFNVSPGTYNTGVKDYMSAAQIVLEIKNWIRK